MISSISLPASTINCNKLISNSLHMITSQYSNFNDFPVHKKNPHKTCYGFCYSPSPQFSLIVQPPIQNSSPSRHRGCSLVAFDGKSSSSGDQEAHRALETVLKFYSAIKNKNIRELSDVIGDECRCVCNFFSFFQPFQGKKQVVDFFSFLIRSLGNNIEFVVKPTLHDGMNVGVAWRLEWKNKNVPLGKGFSFYICQIYQGKVFIRNVEMFMEPLLHIEPFRLKIFGYMMTIMDKLSSYHPVSKNMIKRGLYISLILFFIFVLVFFSKPGLY
ncbi:hypothetical protein Dsin_012836 [Dipteronia sinensis]|uniref:SnoaL-like domain-containing protein n=1 Tax=Dipteronia sinensis TaxID=43782 RepID=A0AAE0AJ07_9ROSI|nr:hypothetical protein Dsin_012836 [Dipteronia sinensis]